jgi:hypothetical protein
MPGSAAKRQAVSKARDGDSDGEGGARGVAVGEDGWGAGWSVVVERDCHSAQRLGALNEADASLLEHGLITKIYNFTKAGKYQTKSGTTKKNGQLRPHLSFLGGADRGLSASGQIFRPGKNSCRSQTRRRHAQGREGTTEARSFTL